MKKLIMEIDAISATLEQLDIQPTIPNMDKLLGCQQHLATIREELEKRAKEEPKNGDADAE